MSDSVYEALIDHMDQYPGGIRTTGDAAKVLLRRLFTHEDAEVALCLGLGESTSADVAERTGLAEDSAAAILSQMAAKGLIFERITEGSPPLYSAVPVVLGIWEHQVSKLDAELSATFRDYFATKVLKPTRTHVGQMRVVPVQEALPSDQTVLPYTAVRELVANQSEFAVAACICRKDAHLSGDGCDVPEESCLIMGDHARHYTRQGWARSITREEFIGFLDQADRHNLVLETSNSREASFICCCCGCCCGVLGNLRKLARPGRYAGSPYVANLEIDACTNCEVCLDRCQMDALVAGVEHVTLNAQRCIGCGLCVSTCPSEALTLSVVKTRSTDNLSNTLSETWQRISALQAEMESGS